MVNLDSINVNYWVLQTIAMALTALLLPGLRITNPLGALGAVVALAFVNAHVWDAALFMSIPDTFSSQAITLIVANGVVFWVLVKILPGIESSGVLPVIAAPLVFSILSMFIHSYAKDVDWAALGERGVAKVQEFRDEVRSAQPSRTPETKNPRTPGR